MRLWQPCGGNVIYTFYKGIHKMKQITQKKGGCDFVVIVRWWVRAHRERDDAMISEYNMR